MKDEESNGKAIDSEEKRASKGVQEEKDRDNKVESIGAEFIITPGLSYYVSSFEAHYEVARRTENKLKKWPTVIVGPRGVGKTLFLHIYEKLYQEEHNITSKAVRANCSHFEKGLARSELFGHAKGAFTDAKKDKKGLVEEADGKLFILEEIGDIPEELQAMLLTFMDTGEYRRIGETRMRTARCEIVGATNKFATLRDDLKDRFFPFYLPPLYQRRGDVLYYLYGKYPDLFKSLTKIQVLTLLCFNWPGNVRDIEKAGHSINREMKMLERVEFWLDGEREGFWAHRLLDLICRERAIPLDTNQVFNLKQDLEMKTHDVIIPLNALINEYGLGMIEPDSAFADISEQAFRCHFEIDPKDEYYKRYGIKRLIRFKPFEEAYKGLQLFCALFFQNIIGDMNIIELSAKNTAWSYFPGFPKGERREYYDLEKSIFQYLSRIRLDKERKWPTDYDGRNALFTELQKAFPKNEFLASLKGLVEDEELLEEKVKEKKGIWSMKEDELMMRYYGGLLKQTDWNIAEAVRHAGLKDGTFRDRLKKLLNDHNPGLLEKMKGQIIDAVKTGWEEYLE